MSNDEVVLNRFVVNKIWQVVQSCVEEARKGWFVKMSEFGDAMDGLDFTAKEVRATLAYLEARTFVITFLDADGGVAGITLVPQRYQCVHCNMWLNMQQEPVDHIGACLRLQRKIERNRVLLR
jgi:hypothetical protein